jgi:NAD(P)-dependent dehydrogenase (short-subunit alcohol dehydrogenase family)
MDLRIAGKTALVTGSTAGIGFAIAKTLAENGARVIVNGRTTASVDQAIAKLSERVSSNLLQGCAADLSNAAGVQKLLDAHGDVDILVNNLGIFDVVPFAEISDAEWMRFFEVNVMSGVRLSRHYLPLMLQKNWGRIIFISSESGICPPGDMVHYGMTKTAQLSVSRGLAEIAAGTGVTVNSVLPGPTKTEGAANFFASMAKDQGITVAEMERKFFAEGRPTSLIKRFVSPDEVASMVAYISSPLAAGTTGAALHVDGGVVRSIV